jgi:hypothetical protein
MIEKHDRTVLRELAHRVAEIAADPAQEERKTLWRSINSLKRCRIPVLLRVNSLYIDEVMPESLLQTADPLARRYERKLRLKIWQWENIDDDMVNEPVVEYATCVRSPRLADAQRTRPDTKTLGALKFTPIIRTESDIDKIVIDKECSVDWDATNRNGEWAQEVFGGILEPMREKAAVWTAPFDYVCSIRGMDNVFADMYERPEWIEEVMRRVYRHRIDTMKALERERALALDNTFQDCYNGGLAYTHELPAPGFDPAHVRLKDVWGASAAQASVSISPEMHERYITRFDREYHALFGLTTAACCEPVCRKMHLYRTLPNLRRLSVCIWNDFAMAAEEIGTDYVFSFKPSAIPLSRPGWEVKQDEQLLRDVLEKARGCHVEIINHETTTVLGHTERLAEWSKMAKRLAVEYSG